MTTIAPRRAFGFALRCAMLATALPPLAGAAGSSSAKMPRAEHIPRLANGTDHPKVPNDWWLGDSRGHWEGNTLVVDVTNNNGKALFGRTGEFAGENAHIEERYIFSADGTRYNYVARITDPTVYTRPWTATIPAVR